MLEREKGRFRVSQRLMIEKASWEIKSIIYNESSNRAEAIKYLYRMLTKGEITLAFFKSNLFPLSGLLLFMISPKLSRKLRIA